MKSAGGYIDLSGIPCFPLILSFPPKAEFRAPSCLAPVTAAASLSSRPGSCHTLSTLGRRCRSRVQIRPEYPLLKPPQWLHRVWVKGRLRGVAQKSCMLCPCSPHQSSVLPSHAPRQGCVTPSSTSGLLSKLFCLLQLSFLFLISNYPLHSFI